MALETTVATNSQESTMCAASSNTGNDCIDLVDNCASEDEAGSDNDGAIRNRRKSDVWHEFDGVTRIMRKRSEALPFVQRLL